MAMKFWFGKKESEPEPFGAAKREFADGPADASAGAAVKDLSERKNDLPISRTLDTDADPRFPFPDEFHLRLFQDISEQHTPISVRPVFSIRALRRLLFLDPDKTVDMERSHFPQIIQRQRQGNFYRPLHLNGGRL